MRRSTKASQLISQSGHDQIYKFRCMEYMNFVLDQVVSDDTKFKLYASHIENLLRNNLNDLTIQDIEKVKRMLEEGQKQKVDIQETGEFINYDLIQKQKYALNQTHFYLEQGPQQALLHLEGHNSYTIHEVQMLKNHQRLERLQEKNYSLLDAMFRLPDVDKKYEEEIQKDYDIKINDIEGENQEFTFEKFENNKFKKSEENKKEVEPVNAVQQKRIEVSQNHNIQEVVSKVEKKSEEKKNKLTPEKPKQTITDQSQKVQPTAVKKKPKKKKPQVPSLQKHISVASEPALEEKIQKPEGQVDVKPNIEANLSNLQQKQQNQNVNKEIEINGNASSVDPQNPQKRKYIRKKPLEPKKPKPEKEKPPKQPKQLKKSKSKSEENKAQMLQQIQSNIEFALKSQAAELNNLLLSSGANDLLNIAPIIPEEKQKEKPSAQLAIKDLIKKQSKSKKAKKSEGQNKEKQKSDSKKSKKHSNNKEIQIVLPFSDCEEQVKKLKVEIENLTKKIQDERLGFQENIHQAISMLTIVQSKEIEEIQKEQKEKKQNDYQEANQKAHEKDNQRIQSILNMEQQNISEHQNAIKHEQSIDIVVPEQRTCQTPQQLVQQVQQISILQAIKEKQIKKPKSTSKIAGSKKQNASSQEYKPLEDELESLQQSDGIDQSKQEDVYQPGKQKKIKKKQSTKKKPKKQSVKSEKQKSKSVSKEKIEKISQDNGVKPSESLVSVQTESKEKKVKLTPEQKEKLKIEKEKMKERKRLLKQKKKEEKLQLIELEKKQREGLKLKKTSKSEKCNKQEKQSQKQINNEVSLAHDNSSSIKAVASVKENKQGISFVQIIKGTQALQQARQLIIEQESLQNPQQKNEKNPLNISNGNSSTKQDISLSFVSFAPLQKLLQGPQYDRQNISQILESEKLEESVMSQKESDNQKGPEFVSIIAGRSITELLDENIATWQEYGRANNGIDSSPKRDKPLDVVEEAQQEQIGEKPKKKIKLACKQSYFFEDPQYGVDDQKEEKKLYTIQVFEKESSQHEEQDKLQHNSLSENNDQMKSKDSQYDQQKKKPQQVPQNLREDSQHSSSLSADDQ